MAPTIKPMPSEQTDDPTLADSGKKAPKILPPNDPSRKDWGILSDSLGLPEHARPSEGSTPEQAAVEMKMLLLRCVQSDKAYEAIIMKCGGAGIGARLKEDPGARATFPEMMSFLKSRLWNRRGDGTRTISQKGREFSTNDVIQDWNPINGGIAKYLQINIGNILSRDWKTSQMELNDPKRDSLDRLAESGREPDTTGRIFSSSAVKGDELDSVDYVENDRAFDKDSERFSVNRVGRGEAPDLEEGDIRGGGSIDEIDVDEDITPQRREFDIALLPSKTISNDSPSLKTTEHPDYRLLAAALIKDVPEPELDAKGRVDQLRSMARDVISLHYQENAEIDDMLDAVSTWDPSKVSFARYFPEACADIAVSLNDAGQKEIKNHDTQLDFAMDLVSVSTELNRQAQVLPEARPAGVKPQEWEDIVATSLVWFHAHANSEEEMRSPSRPDYLALCALTGNKPRADIAPDALSKDLKEMHRNWIDQAFASAKQIGSKNTHVFAENYEAVMEMSKRMQSWNPLVDGFAGETMVQYLNEIRLDQEERARIARERAAAELLAEQTRLALAKPRLQTRPVAIPARPKAHQASFFDEQDFAPEEVRTKIPALTQSPNTSNEPSVK